MQVFCHMPAGVFFPSWRIWSCQVAGRRRKIVENSLLPCKPNLWGGFSPAGDDASFILLFSISFCNKNFYKAFGLFWWLRIDRKKVVILLSFDGIFSIILENIGRNFHRRGQFSQLIFQFHRNLQEKKNHENIFLFFWIFLPSSY